MNRASQISVCLDIIPMPPGLNFLFGAFRYVQEILPKLVGEDETRRKPLTWEACFVSFWVALYSVLALATESTVPMNVSGMSSIMHASFACA